MTYQCPVCQAQVQADTNTCVNCGSRITPVAVNAVAPRPENREPTTPLGSTTSAQPNVQGTWEQQNQPNSQATWGQPNQPNQQGTWGQPNQPNPQANWQQAPYAIAPPNTAIKPKRRNWGLWAIIIGTILLISAAIGAAIHEENRPLSIQPIQAISVLAPTRTPRTLGGSGGGTNSSTATPRPEPTEESQSIDPTPMLAPNNLPNTKGEIIAYSYETYNLTITDAASGETNELEMANPSSFTYGEAEWSPDGSMIIMADRKRNGGVLSLGNRSGASFEELVTIEEGMPYYLYWAPDNSKVAFVISDADDEDYSEQNIYILDIASRSINQLTTDGFVDFTLRWSPDSTNIVYQTFDPENYDYFTHVVNVTDSTIKDIELTIFGSIYWLNESVLVYTGNCGDNFSNNLCGIDINTNSSSIIVELENNESLNDISPNGRWISLEDYSEGSASLYDTTTQSIKIIATDFEYMYWEGWSPDSKYVIFSDYGNDSGIYMYEVESDQPPIVWFDQEYVTWLPER